MDISDLIPGNKYVVLEEVTVCYYEGEDCLMPEGPNLPAGTELTYVGPDDDLGGGYVFENNEGTKYCLHDEDLDFINFAE